ncbi:MAG: CvpA family protein [Candidatus Omnitrophota bacterium]|jgi:uncharacterized membrane protein required for colicin V production
MQNILNVLGLFNWVDIFVLLVFIRLGCISLKTGLSTELLKFTGTFAGLYLSLHYYIILAGLLSGKTAEKSGPPAIFCLSFFILLALSGYIVFFFFRLFFSKLVKAEVVPNLSKWGAFVISLARASLLSSIVLCAFLVSASPYFTKIVQSSYRRQGL